MTTKCGVLETNQTPYTGGKWRDGGVMEPVMTYEERRKRYRLIREINAKIKREKLERYAALRAKHWEKV